MYMKKFLVIAADLGNKEFKLYSGNGRFKVLPNYFKEHTYFENGLFGRGDVKKFQIPSIDSFESYAWGEDVRGVENVIPTYTIKDRYILKPYQLLSKFGIADMTGNFDDVEVFIVTSVPTGESTTTKGVQTIQERQVSESFGGNYKVMIDDTTKTIQSRDVKVFAQAIGSAFDVYFSDDEDGTVNEQFEDFPQSNIIVIDIGGGSVDISKINRGFNIDGNVRFSSNTAMVDVFQTIANRVNEYQPTANATVEKVISQVKKNNREFQISKQVFVSGLNFEQLVREELEKACVRFESMIKPFVRNRDEIDYIIFTGGALENDFVREYFYKWESRIIVPKKPQIANVRGFYKWGVGYAKQRGWF